MRKRSVRTTPLSLAISVAVSLLIPSLSSISSDASIIAPSPSGTPHVFAQNTETPAKAKKGKKQKDADADGIPDIADRCPNTSKGTTVDQFGCEIFDIDADGVVDSLDHCPGSANEDQGRVDIFGCPLDQDSDGVPDIRDSCPNGMIGGIVDQFGCAIDSDEDGIPDGLDLCPETLPGIEVDDRGCVNLDIFNRPMILHPDYLPGSFELDPRTKERLKRLSGLLVMAPSIRVDVYSYTDDIGQDEANRQLSDRRARRAHDYLVSLGIATARIRTFGRGESNFVASNETAEGRAQNRRLELIFLK